MTELLLKFRSSHGWHDQAGEGVQPDFLRTTAEQTNRRRRACSWERWRSRWRSASPSRGCARRSITPRPCYGSQQRAGLLRFVAPQGARPNRPNRCWRKFRCW